MPLLITEFQERQQLFDAKTSNLSFLFVQMCQSPFVHVRRQILGEAPKGIPQPPHSLLEDGPLSFMFIIQMHWQ